MTTHPETAPNTAHPHRYAIAFRWLVRLAGTLLAMAIVVELLLRTFLWGPHALMRDPEIGTVGRPNAHVVRSKEGYFNHHLNERGLVDSPLQDGHSTRVLVLGDSFTQALQVPLDKNFTSITEDLLPGVDVVNAGTSGRSPAFAPAALSKLIDLEPDLVVLQVSESDAEQIFDPSQMHVALDENGEWRVVNPSSYIRYSKLGRAKQWLMSHFSLAQALIGRLEQLDRRERKRLTGKFSRERVTPQASANPWPAYDDETTMSALEWILDRVQEQVPEVVILYVPDIDYESAKLPCLRPHSRPFWHEVARRNAVAIADPTDQMRELFLTRGIASHGFHNLKVGFGHMNEHGHRLSGEALAAILEENLP